MKRRIIVVGALSAVAVCADAMAQVVDPLAGGAQPASQSQATKVDPRFRAIAEVFRRHGPESPYFGPAGIGDARTDGVAAYLRFERPLAAAELSQLESTGVELIRRDATPVALSAVYAAFVPFHSVAALDEHALLRSAEVAWHPKLERPLEITGGDIDAAESIAMPLPAADGTGAVIGDIDSGIDVLHPHFFFADGGAFPWIDVNGNGAFDPGTDAVDYNRDGEADGNETARVLDGAWVDQSGDTDNVDGELAVSFDWIYADSNRDAERNVGADAGFTELDPGYGEPLFVADDVNRNGLLDPDERLYLLATSKVRRFVTSERTWTRGDDLIRAVDSPVMDRSFHGTGVASILVGGQPIAHQRVGIAPGAEIVMYSSHIDAPANLDDTPKFIALRDAVQNGIDVVIHEWTNPYTAPIDGSGNLESAMASARDDGVTQVNPLGNLNLSEKHIEVDVEAAGDADLTFVVDDGFEWGGETFPYSSIYGSLYWRGDHLPTLTLVSPVGTEVVLRLDGEIVEIGENFAQATHTLSDRGTHQVVLSVWNDDEDVSVARGDWTIRISDTEVADRFVGRIADYYSSWSVGVRWATPTKDVGTVVFPATADAAFGVAAYGGRHDQPWENSSVGQLRNYSGRGPRIDDAVVVDIAAPDDPYAALSSTASAREAGYGRSWSYTFGGTSGAGPHVGGAVALLRSLEPEISPDEVEVRILGTARTDEFTPAQLPDPGWGAGKLDVFAAVHGTPAPATNADPIGRVEARVGAGGMVTLSAERSTDDDGDDLSYRWDLEYDGFWDTDWSDSATIESEYEVGAEAFVRLDVRDGRGGRGGAVHRFVVGETAPPDPMPDAGGGDSDVRVVEDTGGERVDLVDTSGTTCGGCASTTTSGSWLSLLALLLGRLRRS